MTSNNEWVPLTTAATQSGRALDYIHGLVREGLIPVSEKPLTENESIKLVRVSDVRAMAAPRAERNDALEGVIQTIAEKAQLLGMPKRRADDLGLLAGLGLKGKALLASEQGNKDCRIARLEDELHHVAQHSLAQGKEAARKEQQLDKVREVAARIDRKSANGEAEYRESSKTDRYLQGYIDGLAIALDEIALALGATDE